MIYYELLTQRQYNSAYEACDTYGITASQSGKILRVIPDISTDRDKINALICRYNEEQLLPEHLDEMIEYFLYDFEV